ncbi:phosphodiester glycosidase family protein [Radiobacillus deserti]|uniref:SLH domain-containing protein n=1 Tax=Radiobacillus deserti TaxID=2594883 RepID=A0A516KJA6_9BACI|nr:phosphodiester glycosidase family protein [Radiobacillus deserti]QDP41483.1 hypothetical protein FN924_15655 [Radiobacillus deserti]
MGKRQQDKNVRYKAGLLFLVILLIFGSFPQASEAATTKVKESFRVSDGVSYKDIRLSDSSTNQAVRVLNVNIGNSNTAVEVGVPTEINKLVPTITRARQFSKAGHRVVGAINGSFFQFGQSMYLVSKNNKLLNAGVVSDGEEYYVNDPIAFGIDKDGKGIIDYYNLDLTYTHDGKTFDITSTNKQRLSQETILYTSDFSSTYTETNHYGTEVVVTLPKAPSLQFGGTYTGEVTAVRPYGDKTKTEIPTNGFVLSGTGVGSTNLSKVKVGDTISVSVDIDSKWKNSSFILASGPLLVENGHVNLSMDPNSYRASERAPRTAVAIDSTRNRVFFVTVDGRQAGYSNGMNLTEFAKYLVSLGADRALNLDGGGSTTMGVRYPGEKLLELANSPSDGVQRSVSTILMAVAKEPGQVYYSDLQVMGSHYEGIQWLTERGIQGYGDGTFGVNKELSRPHAAIMFTRALGLTTPAKSTVEDYFKDVKSTDLYSEFIAAVAKAGIFKGSGGNYNPDQLLTREQMASTLVNAYGLTSTGTNVSINLSNVSASHKQNVQILANLGITNQLKDFRPDEPVSRGQFATFLYLTQQKANQ